MLLSVAECRCLIVKATQADALPKPAWQHNPEPVYGFSLPYFNPYKEYPWVIIPEKNIGIYAVTNPQRELFVCTLKQEAIDSVILAKGGLKEITERVTNQNWPDCLIKTDHILHTQNPQLTAWAA